MAIQPDPAGPRAIQRQARQTLPSTQKHTRVFYDDATGLFGCKSIDWKGLITPNCRAVPGQIASALAVEAMRANGKVCECLSTNQARSLDPSSLGSNLRCKYLKLRLCAIRRRPGTGRIHLGSACGNSFQCATVQSIPREGLAQRSTRAHKSHLQSWIELLGSRSFGTG